VRPFFAANLVTEAGLKARDVTAQAEGLGTTHVKFFPPCKRVFGNSF